MKYVLDSNVFKQLGRPIKNPNVASWLNSVNDRDLYLTVMTVLESQKGIELLRKTGNPDKVKAANSIEVALLGFLEDFDGRILPLDANSAREWGRRLTKHGTKNANDLAIISIVAKVPGAVVISQNTSDFRHRGVTVINPFDYPPSKYSDAET